MSNWSLRQGKKTNKYDTLSVIRASFKSGRNERTGALRRLRDSVLDESFDILSVSKGLGSFLAAFNAKIKACSWGLDDRLGSWHYASIMATYHRSCSSPVLRNRVVFCRWDLRVLLQTPHMHTDLAYHSVTKYIMALAHLWNKYELNQTLSTHVQTQMCLTWITPPRNQVMHINIITDHRLCYSVVACRNHLIQLVRRSLQLSLNVQNRQIFLIFLLHITQQKV